MMLKSNESGTAFRRITFTCTKIKKITTLMLTFNFKNYYNQIKNSNNAY